MKPSLYYKPKRRVDLWGYLDDWTAEIKVRELVHRFDRMGTYIWERCNGHITINEIIKDFAEEHSISNTLDHVETEVLKFLEDCKSKGLIIMNFDFLHPYDEYNDSHIYPVKANVEQPVDILLLFPPSASPMSIMAVEHRGIEPLGIGYLSAFLRSHGFNAGIMNLWNCLINPVTIKDFIKRYDPKIVGISSMTDNYGNGLRIADIIKEINNNIIIIYGGSHVTYDDENTLMNCKSIDVVVRGEGEQTLLELAELYLNHIGELSKIDGISYRAHGEVVRTQNRAFIHDLDSLPFPDRTIEHKEGLEIGMQTSRGCPGQCIFCSAKGLSGGRYRMRSAENVVAEIEFLLNKGVTHIFFQDDTLTADLRRLNKILDLIEEKNLKFTWGAESRVDVLEKAPHVISRMAKTGCFSLQFGIESGSQAMLDALEKNITIKQIYNAVSLAAKEGIRVTCSFLVGHPYETHESVRETYDFAKKLAELGILPILSAVCPYPGTSIAEKPEFYNVEITSYDYLNYNVLSPIMNTPNLTFKEIKKYYHYYFQKLDALYKKSWTRIKMSELFIDVVKNRNLDAS